MTEEHKRKIGEANKGKIRTEEFKKRLSDARKGKKLSAETIKKIKERVTSVYKNPSIRLKISKKLFGHNVSAETRKKISNANKGRASPRKGKKLPKEWIEKFKGKRPNVSEERSFRWKGDSVGYGGLHTWVKKHLGFPKKCEFCGKDGLEGRKINWANKSHKYKRHLSDWIRLCVKCHRNYDFRK